MISGAVQGSQLFSLSAVGSYDRTARRVRIIVAQMALSQLQHDFNRYYTVLEYSSTVGLGDNDNRYDKRHLFMHDIL